MSREKQRQANRLRRLASIIASNPKEYNQDHPARCLVGLGDRLVRGKLITKEEYCGKGNMLTQEERFVKKFGVTRLVANDLFCGDWEDVDKRSKNAYDYKTPYEQRRGATRLLNRLAKRVETGRISA